MPADHSNRQLGRGRTLPHWPGGVSGVTIGPGYDMGHRTPSTVQVDLELAGVPYADSVAVSEGAGKTSSTAETWVLSNSDRLPAISEEASRNLFTLVYPRYAEEVEQIVVGEWGDVWPLVFEEAGPPLEALVASGI